MQLVFFFSNLQFHMQYLKISSARCSALLSSSLTLIALEKYSVHVRLLIVKNRSKKDDKSLLVVGQQQKRCAKDSLSAGKKLLALQKVQLGSVSLLNLATLEFIPRILLQNLNRKVQILLLSKVLFQLDIKFIALESVNCSISVSFL